MSDETIGELHDSLPPGGSTYRRAYGQTWKLTRVPIPGQVAVEPETTGAGNDPDWVDLWEGQRPPPDEASES